MRNRELAGIFDRIADILEFRGDLVFKVNAYRRAARTLEDMAEDVEAVRRQGRLRDYPGIGSAIAAKIAEYLDTGSMAKYEEVKKLFPVDLINLLQVQGLGPKTLALLHRQLKVRNQVSLKKVLESGAAAGLPGMGDKKVANILRGLEHYQTGHERLFLGRAYPIAAGIVRQLRARLKTDLVVPAGSLRRMRETIGDIDILACHPDGRRAVEAFTSLPQAERVLASGDTKGSIVTAEGLQVDLRVVEEKSYGAALQYFTGSKQHNVRIRELARAKGYKVSEYGVFSAKTGRCLAGRDEPGVYAKLGLAWIPPEIREDRGEVEAALKGSLPNLVGLADIKGDLHVHSDWSDGRSSIGELAGAAMKLGYKYIAICDHSRAASYAGGLTAEKLEKQINFIKRFNSKHGTRNFKLLSSSEVDIRPDGSLDFPDSLLARLDIVVASIHSAFTRNVTERIIKACRNPNVDIIGHPTGRLISKRDGYQGLDLEAVLMEAAATGTALEINSFFERLDLHDQNCRRAGGLGCRIAINTDSHHVDHLWMMELGVGVARRGWLEKKSVVNCLPADKLTKPRKP